MLDGKISESKTIQEKKLFMIQDLEESKTWNSDIPVQLIHSISADSKYKVRKAWFGGIVHCTEYVFNQILIDEKYQPVKNELMDILGNDFCNDGFRSRLTTKEDIKRGDEIIDRLLSILKNVK